MVTFNLYQAEGGVIFYDFLPTQKALQYAAEAAASIAGAELLFQLGTLAAPSIAAAGGAIGDLIITLGIAVLDSII